MRPERGERFRGPGIAAALCLLALSACAEGRPMLPSSVAGYAVSGPEVRYGADDLHDYIDGAAEVYRAFGVREARVLRFAKPGAPEIVADVFEMGSAEGAFGAFHHDVREGKPAGIGRESERAGASLAFWKGRFFVSILPSEETGAAGDAVRAIGSAIAAAIEDEGDPPRLADLLPSAGRTVRSVRFVPSKALLDRYFFLADEDLLDLDAEEVEGVLASVVPRDGAAEDAYRVLLVGYPDEDAAGRAARRFLEGYLPDAGEPGLARTENGRFSAVRRAGARTVAVVLDAAARDEAASALDEIATRERGERP